MYLQFPYREGSEGNFPHFHVMYDGFRSQVSIAEGKVSGGDQPHLEATP